MVILLLQACSDQTEDPGIPEMDPARLLTRASLDLRGVRPTEAELEQLEEDPAALEGLLDGFVQDDRFPDRLIPLYHEIYYTNTEGMELRKDNLPFDNPRGFLWEVGQEPLQIIAEVAREDLPYTTIVTADWTMANEDLAEWFPVDWEDGQTGWHKTHYTDGRPAAGVMATNGMWWRYTTTEANANRRRANALTRILVCQDHLDRPIGFTEDINLLDADAIEDALHNNPSCVNCHTTLDPVASNLFGFYWTNFTSVTEGASYHPAKEQMWQDLVGVSPGWFGTPTRGLVDLGAAVAADPRFVTCAVEQAFERMVRRDVTTDDTDDLVELRERFLAGGLKLRELYRAVVDLPVYRAADVEGTRGEPVKMMMPDVLATSVEALTGFRWSRKGMDVMTTDRYGLRAQGGGVDGVQVKRAARVPGANVVLVQQALADEASAYVVATESPLPAEQRRLFIAIDFTETPDTDRAAMAAQLQTLHLRLFGKRVEADGPEVEAGLSLWESLYALDADVPLAWQGVLDALLRDPDFLLY